MSDPKAEKAGKFPYCKICRDWYNNWVRQMQITKSDMKRRMERNLCLLDHPDALIAFPGQQVAEPVRSQRQRQSKQRETSRQTETPTSSTSPQQLRLPLEER